MSQYYNTVGPKIYEFATDPSFSIAAIPDFPHTFLGVIPCDADGDYVAAGAGSVALQVETVNCPGVQQLPAENTINLVEPTDVSFGGNLIAIHGIVTGLTVATHYRVHVSQNVA